jgi:GT2 family glycosyltransferase
MSAIKDLIQDRSTAVIIATRGRPEIVRNLVAQLREQTRPPDHIFVIGSKPDDISGLDRSQPNVTIQIGRTGSSVQRNDALDLAGSRFSYIVFFDDDFVPSRFWLQRMTDVFEEQPDLAGLTGAVLADGTTTAGIAPTEARAMVRQRDARASYDEDPHQRFRHGVNAGCNMAFRYSAIRGMRFDERLPLYAWLEDSDFLAQAGRRGRLARANALWGVHLGHKLGRGRGVTLGYSQIANAVYLARKGTVPWTYLSRLVVRNLVSNVLRSLSPEPFVDRRGRLLGNIIALADLLRGRISPERILAL